MYSSQMEIFAKDYDEPEPDYPLSDSELINHHNNNNQRLSPKLRIFEASDLPLHRGDFVSQHAIMVRSRQSFELAGLMDDTTSNQPTLKRFSRYNQSVHSRPTSQLCDSQPGSSSHQQQSHTYSSKGGSRLKTGLFSGNWTLRSKKEQKNRPSVHNITVVQIGRPSSYIAASDSPVPCNNRPRFLQPVFQDHYQHHQQPCCLNNSGPRDYVHDNDTISLHNHLIPSQNGLRDSRFSQNKSALTPAELAHVSSVTQSSFGRASDNFTLFRARGSNGSSVQQRERLIPVEVKTSKEQTTNQRFPIRTALQRDKIDCVDETTNQNTFCSSQTMRLKKSESCDNVGQGGYHLLQPSSNNRRFEYGEILEEDNEGLHSIPITNASGAVVDDLYDDDDDDDDNNNDVDDDGYDGGLHRKDKSRFGLMRRFGGIKSMGPIRRQWHRPVAEIFPSNAHARSASKDSGLSSTAAVDSAKRNSNSSSSTDERSPTPPASFSQLLIDADSAYRTGTSDLSPSSMSSSNDRQQQLMLRKSCPDLRASGTVSALPKTMGAYRTQNRNRRAREKRQAAVWRIKPIKEWNLDDVLLWLQYCKLDDVASIMIGYDINGSDVERWNDNILEHLGVVAKKTRTKILRELQALKERQVNPTNATDHDGNTSKKGKPRVPLFKLVRSNSYDKVVAVETSLTTRDITVAEGRFGCLQVTKVNGANIPLKEQDCFLEINDMPGQAFCSPLMFTKLVSEAAGEPIRLVVLRRRTLPIGSTDGEYDDDNDTSSRGTCLEKVLQTTDQESSASSGVSSSELSSEMAPLVDDNKSHVLRL